MHYVAGFVFRKHGTEVALIRKAKPAYMAGCLNGIGGAVERGEKAVDAQVRETAEESGLQIPAGEWMHYAQKLTNRGDLIDFFGAQHDLRRHGILTSLTSEPVDWYPLDRLAELKTFSNLAYLIPMAQLRLSGRLTTELLQLIET